MLRSTLSWQQHLLAAPKLLKSDQNPFWPFRTEPVWQRLRQSGESAMEKGHDPLEAKQWEDGQVCTPFTFYVTKQLKNDSQLFCGHCSWSKHTNIGLDLLPEMRSFQVLVSKTGMKMMTVRKKASVPWLFMARLQPSWCWICSVYNPLTHL